MKERSSENESRLIINQNDIEFHLNKNFFQIPIQKSITLNYYESNVVSRKYAVNYDFIKIFKSFNSKSIIKFGPFEELPKLLTFLFVHFIIWKYNHGFLLSKNQLINLKSKPHDDILNEIEKEHHKEEIRAIKIRESIRKSKNQEIYQQNFEYYKNFQPYFDPDEYLVHHAKPNLNLPNVNLFTARIEIISGVSYCILIFVFLIFLLVPTPFLPILSLVMLIISVLGAFTLCLFGSGNYLKIKENKDSIYVLTNKKIIIKNKVRIRR